MSRTDAHRPPDLHLYEAARQQHDHRDHECDLPSLREWIAQDGKHANKCHWVIPEWYTHQHNMCGCPLCRPHGQHRRERRRDRVRARLSNARLRGRYSDDEIGEMS